jgi:CheY-like chemotaxis protein
MDNLPILLAEDNEDDVFLMQRAFAKARVPNPIRVVTDGEQALTYLRGEGVYADRNLHPFPGLLLLDIKMPRMNGLEVLSVIRNDPRLKRLVIIVLTSSNQARDIDGAFEMQANSYLVKPARPEAMAGILEKLKDYWLAINNFPECPSAEPA